MKRSLCRFLVSSLCVLLIFSSSSAAFAEEIIYDEPAENYSQEIPTKQPGGRSTFQSPALSEAKAALVVDQSGNIIFGDNINAEYNMASITKVMTAVVALEHGFDLSGYITCQGCTLDENAQLAGYSAGETVSARDLFLAMMVFSANDAAYEVACSVAGSEQAFVKLMNARAQELGMNNTVFKNCHGLDAKGHHSTVSDLIILARYAMTNFPTISEAVKLEGVTVKVGGYEVYLKSTDNFVLGYSGALGIKTGMGNDTACFLGAARRNGVTLYSCVLGCSTSDGRFVDTITLMDEAFATYEHIQLATTDHALDTLPFAYHFGFCVEVLPDSNTTGLFTQKGERCLSILSPNKGGLVDLNSSYGVYHWTQDKKVVGSISAHTSSKLVTSKSGFGLTDKLIGQA